MPSMEEARQYYEKHNKNPRLTLKTFYGRVHAFGWSYEKALSYPVKFLKLQKGPNYSENDVDEYYEMKYLNKRSRPGTDEDTDLKSAGG